MEFQIPVAGIRVKVKFVHLVKFSAKVYQCKQGGQIFAPKTFPTFRLRRGRTGLMVRASGSGSGDPGSILDRVGVFVSLSKRHLLPKSTGNTQE